MGQIYHGVEEIVGNTPLMYMARMKERYQFPANIFAKLEYLNPSGSVKDRTALSMILDAEEKGLLKPNATIIEPTSGNTGIGLAAMGIARGYQVIMVMPDTMSEERRNILRAYGAKIVLTDGALGMKGSIDKAEELHKQLPDSMIAGQFVNPANWEAHYKTTGPEIWNDLNGDIDILIAGVGTGGTLTGAGKYLKEKNPKIQVIAVEPEASPVLSKGRSGRHGIQGIGANFVPEVLDQDVYDEVYLVGDKEAINWAKAITKSEGVLVGISAGAAMCAAAAVAAREENKGKNIVVILPDSGDRYYSTALFI